MNLNPIVAQVIQSGKATLRELKETYSMHDLYDLWEVVHTELYNKWIQRESEIRSMKLSRR